VEKRDVGVKRVGRYIERGQRRGLLQKGLQQLIRVIGDRREIKKGGGYATIS